MIVVEILPFNSIVINNTNLTFNRIIVTRTSSDFIEAYNNITDNDCILVVGKLYFESPRKVFDFRNVNNVYIIGDYDTLESTLAGDIGFNCNNLTIIGLKLDGSTAPSGDWNEMFFYCNNLVMYNCIFIERPSNYSFVYYNFNFYNCYFVSVAGSSTSWSTFYIKDCVFAGSSSPLPGTYDGYTIYNVDNIAYMKLNGVGIYGGAFTLGWIRVRYLEALGLKTSLEFLLLPYKLDTLYFDKDTMLYTAYPVTAILNGQVICKNDTVIPIRFDSLRESGNRLYLYNSADGVVESKLIYPLRNSVMLGKEIFLEGGIEKITVNCSNPSEVFIAVTFDNINFYTSNGNRIDLNDYSSLIAFSSNTINLRTLDDVLKGSFVISNFLKLYIFVRYPPVTIDSIDICTSSSPGYFLPSYCLPNNMFTITKWADCVRVRNNGAFTRQLKVTSFIPERV